MTRPLFQFACGASPQSLHNDVNRLLDRGFRPCGGVLEYRGAYFLGMLKEPTIVNPVTFAKDDEQP